MKRLTLIRHAKSSWNRPQLDDFDRPLNKRGKHDAPMMGVRLKKLNFCPDLIISSPARRAIKTARTIAGEIGYPKKKIVSDEGIYEATVTTLMEIIHNLSAKNNHVMLFGHNPGFTYLHNFLSTISIDNIPTCGIGCLEFGAVPWSQLSEESGRTVFFDYPQNNNPSELKNG